MLKAALIKLEVAMTLGPQAFPVKALVAAQAVVAAGVDLLIHRVAMVRRADFQFSFI